MCSVGVQPTAVVDRQLRPGLPGLVCSVHITWNPDPAPQETDTGKGGKHKRGLRRPYLRPVDAWLGLAWLDSGYKKNS